jgi:hypothetical protein
MDASVDVRTPPAPRASSRAIYCPRCTTSARRRMRGLERRVDQVDRRLKGAASR